MPEWPPSVNQQTASAGEGVERGGPRAPWVGAQAAAAAVETA